MTPRVSDVAPANYAPPLDAGWTLDIEAEFFARLDERHPHMPTGRSRSEKAVSLSAPKAALLREYATDTLSAQRISNSYLSALSAILGRIAAAELAKNECVISQRDAQIGSRRTVRNIQAQLEAAGVFVRARRTQGYGFVGEVFVYRPSSAYAPRGLPAVELERAYRAREGEADYPAGPDSVGDGGVPF